MTTIIVLGIPIVLIKVDLSYKKIISQLLSAKKHFFDPALQAVLPLPPSPPPAPHSLVGFCPTCTIVCSTCLRLSPIQSDTPWRRGHVLLMSPLYWCALCHPSVPLCPLGPHSCCSCLMLQYRRCTVHNYWISNSTKKKKIKVPNLILYVQLYAGHWRCSDRSVRWHPSPLCREVLHAEMKGYQRHLVV